jgi:NAD(P)H dehydrogenase (quinone)
MKHAIIVGHPNPKSFTRAVAAEYETAAQVRGDECIVRDLYAIGFDPRLGAGEIPRPGGFAPGVDVARERELLAGVDVFAFVYPLWFNVPPAVVTGYVQRVFGMGFGYGPIREGRNQPLLEGRRLISFSSSGAPTEWLKTEGGWEALRNLFDRHVAETCGMRALDHVHFGRVSAFLPQYWFDAYMDTVRRTVSELSET